MGWSNRRASAVAMFTSLAAAGPAAADERPSGGGQTCGDWCGTPHAWATPPGAAGPETSAATTLGLGVAGETLRLADGRARTETAALFAVEGRIPLALSDSSPGFDERVVRVRLVGQRLGWRTGDAIGDTADSGGSVGLGFTETLAWFSHQSKLAMNLDLEGATGLGVREGLGLRTSDVSSRAVAAGGLSLGIDGRAGGLRVHGRALHALTDGAGWANAAEVGAGVATRFDWPGLRGPWPFEAWVDVRERRGLGDASAARDRELSTGLSYVPPDGFSRIGLVAIATEERLADGTTGTGRALMVRFERPHGGL